MTKHDDPLTAEDDEYGHPFVVLQIQKNESKEKKGNLTNSVDVYGGRMEQDESKKERKKNNEVRVEIEVRIRGFKP